jgi:hypothetical protein
LPVAPFGGRLSENKRGNPDWIVLAEQKAPVRSESDGLSDDANVLEALLLFGRW